MLPLFKVRLTFGAFLFIIELEWSFTRSAVRSPAFEGGVDERGSG